MTIICSYDIILVSTYNEKIFSIIKLIYFLSNNFKHCIIIQYFHKRNKKKLKEERVEIGPGTT